MAHTNISSNPDVVVIGAGAAGLAAARRIGASGRSVAIIEARDRIGGRVHTVHDPSWELPVELGAEFIHGNPLETWEIVRAARLPVFEYLGDYWFHRDGALTRRNDFWDIVQEIMRTVPKRGRDISFDEHLDRFPNDKRHREAKLLARGYVEGFHAARTEIVSARSLSEAEETAEGDEGERAYRIISGYDSVPRWLLAGLEPSRTSVRLSTIVTSIRWRKGSVVVEVENPAGRPLETIRAKQAVITVPVGVLQAGAEERGAIRFEPDLGPTRAAIEQLTMGTVVKIVLRFRRRFWREFTPGDGEEGSLASLGFLLSRDRTMPTWWTPIPIFAPVLTGWAGGPSAERLAGRKPERILELALDSLSRLLGVSRSTIDNELDVWHLHDWQSDPFSRGAYSYLPAGAMAAQRRLTQPIRDTLFFAGEATCCDGQTGTVHGAIASGRRAAAQLLRIAD